MTAPFLLDITRLISRYGMGPHTGIDRVERAYLDHFVNMDRPAWFLAKLGKQFALIDPKGGQRLLQLIEGNASPGRARLQDAVRFKISVPQRRIRSAVRQLSYETCGLNDLKAMLSGHSFDYYNVGHSNLSAEVLQSIKRANPAGISVLIHDMIPLDFPRFTRPETRVSFEERMRAVAQFADRVICNSSYTAERVDAVFSTWGKCPTIEVSLLGVEKEFLARQDSAASGDPAYFVILGTIEGRKNHKMLFDVWSELPDPPKLFVVGKRGWCADEAHLFLDSSALAGEVIVEHSRLADEDLLILLLGARALLFPSLVEGFGLPAAEAATLGTPVIASDIPALREVLGANGKFINKEDSKLWKEAIELAVRDKPIKKKFDWVATTWEDHFNQVIG